MPGDLQKSKDAGCDDFISKPVRLDDLLAKIKEWMSKDPDTWMPLRLSRRKPPNTAAG
jgi:CheY-like chemotaxis protein